MINKRLQDMRNKKKTWDFQDDERAIFELELQVCFSVGKFQINKGDESFFFFFFHTPLHPLKCGKRGNKTLD